MKTQPQPTPISNRQPCRQVVLGDRSSGGWKPNGGPWDDDTRGHLALWAWRQAGATIRGVLGAQTGAGGAVDVTDGVTQAVAPWGQ